MPLPEGLLAPIPGDNPCGPNLSYSPEFDKIRKARQPERDDYGQLVADLTTVDWREVIRLITVALTSKTKDVHLAAWLTEALLATQGFGGFQEGLELTHALLETFWENIHPELEDGDAEMRATPLEWLGNYLDPANKWSPAFVAQMVPLTASGLNWLQYAEGQRMGYEAEVASNEQRKKDRAAAIKDGKLEPEKFDAAVAETPKAFYKKLVADLTACAASVDALDKFCGERFGSVAPSFINLKRVLAEITVPARSILKKKLELEPDPPEAPDEAAAAVAVGAGAAAAAPALAPSGLSTQIASREDAVQHIIAAARRLRQDNVRDPAAYLVLRALRWGEVRAAGTQLDVRLLLAPNADLRTRVRKFALDGQWAELLASVEEATALPCGRGWLDLQRYAVSACEHLGDDYAPVAFAIRGALRDYLLAFPQLPRVTLMDDTPAANAETQQWISEQVAPGPGLQQILSASPGAAGNGSGDVYRDALEAAHAGRHADALALLARYAPENSGRARFLHKLQLVKVLMAAGRARVAYPIVAELAQEIETRKLDEWESPALVASVLALQFHCLKELQLDPDTREKIQQRLCLLDPVQALGCSE